MELVGRDARLLVVVRRPERPVAAGQIRLGMFEQQLPHQRVARCAASADVQSTSAWTRAMALSPRWSSQLPGRQASGRRARSNQETDRRNHRSGAGRSRRRDTPSSAARGGTWRRPSTTDEANGLRIDPNGAEHADVARIIHRQQFHDRLAASRLSDFRGVNPKRSANSRSASIARTWAAAACTARTTTRPTTALNKFDRIRISSLPLPCASVQSAGSRPPDHRLGPRRADRPLFAGAGATLSVRRHAPNHRVPIVLVTVQEMS